jgi:quinoprotein glucose dehydrogenase
MVWSFRFLGACCLIVLLSGWMILASPDAPSNYNPPLAKASDEAQKAISRFKRDKALNIEVWAAEPMMAHPVCFAFDEKGRCYVAETFRHSNGVTDNRSHMGWLDQELAARTVADRVALYQKDAGKRFKDVYETHRDRVRLLEDTTGSGRADKATVFCDNFGRAEDGIGAGLLARKGNVYFTCIPDLWLLKDTKGTGRADVQESLSTGYGVHVAFIGHDLHGLRMGPDGKIYFSCGDRGFNVKTKEGKQLFYPDTGGVLRCDPDGANLEVVHIGLRNPQELAFDDFGNLFTVDNNSDSGDRARWVYIVEGGDSGWRIGYQYGSDMHDSSVRQGNRGPWNYEQLWVPLYAGQPAYIVPPLKNFADGPSGFCHYPGLGLDERYQGHFFLSDFRGSSGGSGVWSFAAKPKGAAFEMVDTHQFVWSILATDCDFGPDCGFYIADWVEGWNLNGKGRLYKVTDPNEQKKPLVAGVRQLLAEGFDQRPIDELVKLLGHPHQQVRMEAQFALAGKGKPSIEAFTKVIKDSKQTLARLHAIWGLGMVGRNEASAADPLVGLVKDADAEVRAQAAKILGEFKGDAARKAVLELLKDSEARVAFFAATSAGKGVASPANVEPLFDLVRANDNKDVYLRQATVNGLKHSASEQALTAKASDPSPAVRLAAVLALRGQKAAGLQEFLRDTDPLIVAEAARAIHDEDVTGALAKLAALTVKTTLPPAVLYRALNANFKLGAAGNAVAVAEFAARGDASESLRIFALKLLADWSKPARRDHVTGLTQNLPSRDESIAASAFRARIGGIFAGSAGVQKEAASVAGKLGIKEVGPFLLTLVNTGTAPVAARIEAVRALDALKAKQLDEAVRAALASNQPGLRNAARAALVKTQPAEVLKQIQTVLANPKADVAEMQGAMAILAGMKGSEADALIEDWLEKVSQKTAPPEIALDVLQAAAKRDSERLKRRLSAYNQARPKGDDLANFREALYGGDAENGGRIFLTSAVGQCQRCHKLDGQGGDVGPMLNGLGGKQKRDYLLESIVLPNKQIAKGFESVRLTLLNGKTIDGVLRGEDKDSIKVITPEGQLLTIKKEDIDERRTGKSAMPDDLAGKLSKSEIRDLVEFLAGLKEEWKK